MDKARAKVREMARARELGLGLENPNNIFLKKGNWKFLLFAEDEVEIIDRNVIHKIDSCPWRRDLLVQCVQSLCVVRGGLVRRSYNFHEKCLKARFHKVGGTTARSQRGFHCTSGQPHRWA